MNKKIIIFVTAMVLVLAMATGATFAYLFAEGDPITNTFAPTRIGSIAVSESGATSGKKNFTVIPGVSITKDPKIQYSPDDNTPNVATIVVFATLDLAGTTWTFDKTNNKFTYTDANANTLDFTINTTNWFYVGRAGTSGNKHVLVYKKVLDGTKPAGAFAVIQGNTINVSEGWTEAQLATAFGAGGVKITVSSSVSQAMPNIEGAVGDSVAVADAKNAWNAISSTDIP